MSHPTGARVLVVDDEPGIAGPDEPVSTVARRLMKDAAREAFIMDGGRLVGMVCCRDLVRVIAGVREVNSSSCAAAEQEY